MKPNLKKKKGGNIRKYFRDDQRLANVIRRRSSLQLKFR